MIYLREYLNAEFVLFLQESDKKSVLNRMVDCLSSSPNILDRESFRKAVFEREKIISTGIGLGIAIPHVMIEEVKNITIGIGISKEGIPWEALDNKPVHAVFLFAGAADQHELYLRLLSKIILVLRNKERRHKLFTAKNVKQLLDLFNTL